MQPPVVNQNRYWRGDDSSDDDTRGHVTITFTQPKSYSCARTPNAEHRYHFVGVHVKTENGSNTERAIFQYRDLRDPQNPPCSIHTSLSAKKKETHAKTKNWSTPKGCHFILRTFRGPQHPWLYNEDKKRKRCLKKHGTRTERVTFHLQN